MQSLAKHFPREVNPCGVLCMACSVGRWENMNEGCTCTSKYMCILLMTYSPSTCLYEGTTGSDTCPPGFAIRACIGSYYLRTRAVNHGYYWSCVEQKNP